MRGDYETALDGLRTSRERCRQTGDSYHAALCDLDQSEIYIELNLPGEAAALAQTAREEFEKMGMDFETARAIANLAIARHQQQDASQALSLFESAAAIFQRAENEAWQALVHLYQALVLFETGVPAEALRLSCKALEYFDASGLERRAVLCHLLIARVSLAQSDLLHAREHCDSALRKIGRIEDALPAIMNNRPCQVDARTRSPSARKFPPGKVITHPIPAAGFASVGLLRHVQVALGGTEDGF